MPLPRIAFRAHPRAAIRTLLAAAVFAALAAPPCAAAEVTVEFFRSSFLPESVTIEAGDTVRFVRVAGTHTLRSGRPDGAPGTPDAPGALFEAILDETNTAFAYTFEEFRAEGYSFFDPADPSRIGFISVSSGAVSLRVAVVDNVFNPEVAAIFAGDTIRWEHEPMEDYHTITSGLSSRPQHNPGALFDAESSEAKPIFAYEFAAAGDYPYFCRPHEQMGMTGLVIVQSKFLRGDGSGDASVDISDAVFILGVLFLGTSQPACPDALDANDDGGVDIADPTFLLNYLFLGGARIPRPFPLPGGDRTEDEMLCRS